MFWDELAFLVTYDKIMNFSSQKYKSACVLANVPMVTFIIIKKLLKKWIKIRPIK